MWLADGIIRRSLVNGKPKYILRVPEIFMRAIEKEESIGVSIYSENGSLKVIPNEEK
jgi:hypothetical protein